MRKGNGSIVVYDPDYGNPYGKELALLLSDGLDVRYAGALSGWRPEAIHTLSGHKFSRDGHSRISILWSYFSVLVAVILRAILGDTIILVWCRGAADRYLFRMCAKFNLRIVYVVHNPKSRRPESRLLARSERGLRENARLVIHSDRLRHLLEDPTLESRVMVVPHLPYSQYVAHHKTINEHRRAGHRVLFLGQLRPDKSPMEMADFLRVVPRDFDGEFVFCGRGQLTPEIRNAAEGLMLVDRMDSRGVDDHLLTAEVTNADVLVAPYRQVTQSGSVVLALSFGVPVAAYSAGALPDLVDDRCLVPLGDSQRLFEVVRGLLAEGVRVEMPDVNVWRNETLSAWMKALVD
ncbi:glycosyltransferase [uncultured Arthrobacter sp.]|uniref:glycosyltransferase n=1 Tax=uncultured Arthrobacter sp. TaxID=114050 RepID=UPI00260EE998|nr:glycosyltransferase [uncultured Arthrobacter sp.]